MTKNYDEIFAERREKFEGKRVEVEQCGEGLATAVYADVVRVELDQPIKQDPMDEGWFNYRDIKLPPS